MKPVVSTLLDRAADLYGSQRALVTADTELTFVELRDRVNRFSSGLESLGVGRGQAVVLHLPNSWQWVVAYHAIARLGAVIVPANILLSAAEVAYLATDSEAMLLIAPSDRVEGISALIDDADARKIKSIGVGGNDTTYDLLLQSPPRVAVEVEPDDLVAIAYTSGTTGKPKGAMLAHRSVYLSTALFATTNVRTPADRVITALPLPHVYGNIVMNAGLMSGATVILLDRFTAQSAFHAIADHRATIFDGVPTMYYQMLSSPEMRNFDLSSLRCCTVGGQTMPIANIIAVEREFGCPLLELWGMTEVAGPAISHSPYAQGPSGSIGVPYSTMEARIVDLFDASKTLPPGEAGELMVRGPLVMKGYWRNSEATASTLTDDGWLYTGDLGYRDGDVHQFIVDREKDLIITAGYNIYPAELEQVLAAHPDVSMAAVVSVPDAEKGELAKAFVVLKAGAKSEAADILAHCRTNLAAYKVPRIIEFVADLPRTSTGKILRRALRSEADPTSKPSTE